MAGGSCGEGVLYVAWLRGPAGYRLGFGAGEEALVGGGPGFFCIVVDAGQAEADVREAALGELYASLLLAAPERVEGDEGLYREHLALYASRVAEEENHKLRRLLGSMLHRHALAAPQGLLVARMASLAKIYFWLRPLYNATVAGPGARHLWEASLAYSGGRRWLPLSELGEREPSGPLSASPRATVGLALEAAGPDILRRLPSGLLAEGLSARPAPPLRDPLLYVRLDHARLATRLVGFERQLYALTNVDRALRLRRSGLIRSVSIVEAGGGFRPAVVKRYRDATMAKWLLAALLSLPLPKPRIAPKLRLGAEYHYNRVLASKGYNVPEPILVDPRRMAAAYSYIEGRTLSSMLRDNPATHLYHRLGSLLAALHGDSVAVWDTNPSNIIVAGPEEKLYLVDLEQARSPAGLPEKAWDIAVAAYYSIVYAVASAPARAAMLARGYIEAGGDPAAVAEASKYKYAAPFAAATPLNVLEKTRRALAREAAKP